MSLLGAIYLGINGCFRDSNFVSSISKHLIQVRYDMFKHYSTAEKKVIVMYRFSHAGLSDLYDHVRHLQEQIKNMSYREEGGTDNLTRVEDRIISKVNKNLTGYITKKAH